MVKKKAFQRAAIFTKCLRLGQGGLTPPYGRDTKIQNFPVGIISCAKTFRTECVNRFRDISAPKVRKSLSRHTCQSAKTILTKVQDMNVATILQTIKYLPERCPDCLESFQTVWKVSKQSGNFLHCPETFHTVKKISRLSGNFPDQLGTFQTVWKLSGSYGNFPYRLESFQSVRKLSRLSGNFPNCLETF